MKNIAGRLTEPPPVVARTSHVWEAARDSRNTGLTPWTSSRRAGAVTAVGAAGPCYVRDTSSLAGARRTASLEQVVAMPRRFKMFPGIYTLLALAGQSFMSQTELCLVIEGPCSQHGIIPGGTRKMDRFLATAGEAKCSLRDPHLSGQCDW
jgi:hypothetical protein